jgi:hypothetical protein
MPLDSALEPSAILSGGYVAGVEYPAHRPANSQPQDRTIALTRPASAEPEDHRRGRSLHARMVARSAGCCRGPRTSRQGRPHIQALLIIYKRAQAVGCYRRANNCGRPNAFLTCTAPRRKGGAQGRSGGHLAQRLLRRAVARVQFQHRLPSGAFTSRT